MRHFHHLSESMHWNALRSAPRRERNRTPSVSRLIKQARKAGDHGPVRIEVTDARGRTVTVTSQPQRVDLAQANQTDDEWSTPL